MLFGGHVKVSAKCNLVDKEASAFFLAVDVVCLVVVEGDTAIFNNHIDKVEAEDLGGEIINIVVLFAFCKICEFVCKDFLVCAVVLHCVQGVAEFITLVTGDCFGVVDIFTCIVPKHCFNVFKEDTACDALCVVTALCCVHTAEIDIVDGGCA